MFYKFLACSLLPALCCAAQVKAPTPPTPTTTTAVTPKPLLIRSEYRYLSFSERERHLNAVVKLFNEEREFIKNVARVHNEYFKYIYPDCSLPWNRYVLMEYEKRLQVHGGNGAGLPYFNAAIDAYNLKDSLVFKEYGAFDSKNQCIRDGFIGRIINPDFPCIKRGRPPNCEPLAIPSIDEVTGIVSTSSNLTVFSWRSQMEYMSVVHSAIGGTLDSKDSPFDPLFYLFRASLDRIFYSWQYRFVQAPQRWLDYNVGIARASNCLPGFPNIKMAEVLNITTLPYKYDSLT